MITSVGRFPIAVSAAMGPFTKLINGDFWSGYILTHDPIGMDRGGGKAILFFQGVCCCDIH